MSESGHSYTRGFDKLARVRSNTETVELLEAQLDAMCVDTKPGALRVYTEQELQSEADHA